MLMGQKLSPRGYYDQHGNPILKSVDIVWCPDDDPDAMKPENVVSWVGSDPRKPDKNGDTFTPEAMRDAVRGFMARPQLGDKLEVVEAHTEGDRLVTTLRVNDSRLWEHIRAGEVRGISMGFRGVRVKLKWWQRLWRWLTRPFRKAWRWATS